MMSVTPTAKLSSPVRPKKLLPAGGGGDPAPSPSSSPFVDPSNLATTIRATSLLLWVPHGIVLAYLAASISLSSSLFTLATTLIATALTFAAATRLEGDWLMVVCGVTGLFSELAGLGSTSGDGSDGDLMVSRNVWVVVSALHGLFGGLLCKAKDLDDGRFYEHHTIAERLYVVAPFTIGQWVGFIVANGWVGVVKAFSSIFLCLATVGYVVVAYRVMKYFGIFQGDLIALVTKLFTTSFGVVFGGLAAAVAFLFYIAMPFMQALLSLNALVSSVGMIIEVLIYDVA